MLSPLPGTSYIAMLPTHHPTPTVSLTQVPQKKVTASALKPEEHIKKKTNPKSEKSTQ